MTLGRQPVTMSQCDVCFVECVDVGVLACKHVVCRSCGMSQSKCLVCARVGRNSRRRLGKRVIISRPVNSVRVEDVIPRGASKESSPEVVDVTPHLSAVPAVSPPTQARPSSLHSRRHPHTPKSPDVPVETTRIVAPVPPPAIASPAADDASPEPPLKMQRKENSLLEKDTALKTVHGPTAFDEVRCELRALGSAPKLQRAALRTTGKLSVALLCQFVHQSLNLPDSASVVLRCSGEDLTGAMTLGHLVTHVWPETEGHMILDYRIARQLTEKRPGVGS